MDESSRLSLEQFFIDQNREFESFVRIMIDCKDTPDNIIRMIRDRVELNRVTAMKFEKKLNIKD